MQVFSPAKIAVALRKESVDRNHYWDVGGHIEYHVALRKESVDRNSLRGAAERWSCVALRKESVDRNVFGVWLAHGFYGSLSARRAWIEMTIYRELKRGAYGRSPQGERG